MPRKKFENELKADLSRAAGVELRELLIINRNYSDRAENVSVKPDPTRPGHTLPVTVKLEFTGHTAAAALATLGSLLEQDERRAAASAEALSRPPKPSFEVRVRGPDSRTLHKAEVTVISNTDGFEFRRRQRTVAVVKFTTVERAVKRLKWLMALGRNTPEQAWSAASSGQAVHKLRLADELQFAVKQGSVIGHLNVLNAQVSASVHVVAHVWTVVRQDGPNHLADVLNAQVKECFQELAGTLRREDVTDKEMMHLEPLKDPLRHAFFQRPRDHDDNRQKHVPTLLASELGELMHQFDYALKAAIHIPKDERELLQARAWLQDGGRTVQAALDTVAQQEQSHARLLESIPAMGKPELTRELKHKRNIVKGMQSKTTAELRAELRRAVEMERTAGVQKLMAENVLRMAHELRDKPELAKVPVAALAQPRRGRPASEARPGRLETINEIGTHWSLQQFQDGLTLMEQRNAEELEQLERLVMVFDQDGNISSASQAAWGDRLGSSGGGGAGADAGLDRSRAASANEDLMVFYGVVKNYQALVEALLEVDSVMFNGDDQNFGRVPVMLHSHAWTATEMASQFVPAGYGPSWYKMHYDANMSSV